MKNAELTALLQKPEFPRSAKYEADWMMENQMGPNALWLLEWLCEGLPIERGMRVLDLGCGKAMTSIFLAREFGAKVWAADLWINPDANWRRVVEAGVEDLVCPIRAEAHALPFAEGFFDAVISIDAYQYFGTDELYLDYLSRFVGAGGLLGVVVPALMRPLEGEVPAHLTKPQKNGKPFWESECRSFKTAEFWRALWAGSPMVKKISVEPQKEGWRHWRDFERALEISGKSVFPSEVEALEEDGGRWIGFVRCIASRAQNKRENFYDPFLGAIVGVDK